MELTNLEGKKTDNLEATSASEATDGEAVVEPTPQLNNSPVPTEDEVKDADLTPVDNNVDAAPSDSPEIANENVNAVPENNEPTPVVEENGVTDTPAMRTYTQDEYQNGLNEIAGKTRIETREKTFRYIYDRYGVADEAGLDELIGNAQRYDSLKEQYDGDKANWKEQSSARDKELADVKEQVALMQSGIDSSRYEDAKLIIKGKGLEVTTETINNELATHPEWKKSEAVPANDNFMKVDDTKPQETAEPASKISVLGNDNTKPPVEDEEAMAMKLFKV
jgi:hypothetical protein